MGSALTLRRNINQPFTLHGNNLHFSIEGRETDPAVAFNVSSGCISNARVAMFCQLLVVEATCDWSAPAAGSIQERRLVARIPRLLVAITKLIW